MPRINNKQAMNELSILKGMLVAQRTEAASVLKRRNLAQDVFQKTSQEMNNIDKAISAANAIKRAVKKGQDAPDKSLDVLFKMLRLL